MARQRGRAWQADAVVDGKRVRPSFKTKEEAEAFEANAERMSNLSEASVGTLFPKMCDELWSKTKDYKGAKQIVEDLIERIGPSVPVFKITDEVVDDLIQAYEDEGKANQTINNKLTRLSKLLKRAKRKKLITSLPIIELRKQTQGRIRFLSAYEEQAMFEHMSEGDRHFCNFLLYTGCRYSEAVNLEWRDVNGNVVTFWLTKSGKPRSVPLARKAKEALEWALGRVVADTSTKAAGGLPRGSEGLSSKGPWSWVSYISFRQRWQTARIKAGLGDDDQVVPHVLRHTCASRLVQNGVDIRRVKEWLGHASINTTMRYAHLAPSDLEGLAKALDAA